MRKKILICAGGTGGHIYPALAVVECIKEKYPRSEISFIGSERGPGAELMSGYNVSYRTVKSCGLVLNVSMAGKILNTMKFIYFLIYGFFQSLRIVLNFKPDIILGMGGYICAPVLLAGIFTAKKIALHEQNYIPGRLNSFFSKFAKYIFISFSDTEKYLRVRKNRVFFTGNPLRKIMRESDKNGFKFKKWGLEEGKFTVVAFGGSLGAENINNAIMNLYSYIRNDEKIQILLIPGRRFFKEVDNNKKNIINPGDKLIFKIFEYINEMNEIYKLSDLVVSRAGANTISEIIEYNIPSILVPYPHAVANHQYYNANYLAERGKAVLVNDNELDGKKVYGILKMLARDNWKKYKEIKGTKIEGSGTDSAGIIASGLMED
ncbi:MAG: UDP-N-acetylglucosamine--N-acetylmuramyl-(pentapeptide) pyrophosphoryl-undecaprenol N-acetylglucosamine transferase [Actinomycetota bacterium]|nr:UDP-N-acetylglucosamine--N-acetylmuramyl-(pentapeptide) pyrophosphoryl-undecaprenol N-acetylglucosamine transferase [Actinomycetota bacterium]